MVTLISEAYDVPMWYALFFGSTAACAGALSASAVLTKRTISSLPEWKQGIAGTSLIFGLLAWLATLCILISGLAKGGGVLIVPMAIMIWLLCPAAILLSLILRTKGALFLLMAEIFQACVAFLLLTTGGVL